MTRPALLSGKLLLVIHQQQFALPARKRFGSPGGTHNYYFDIRELMIHKASLGLHLRHAARTSAADVCVCVCVCVRCVCVFMYV